MVCCTHAPWTDVGVVGRASYTNPLRLGWIVERAGQLMRMLPGGGDETAHRDRHTTVLWLSGCLLQRLLLGACLLFADCRTCARSPGTHARLQRIPVVQSAAVVARELHCGVSSIAELASPVRCHAAHAWAATHRTASHCRTACSIADATLPATPQANSARYCRRSAAPAAYISIHRRSSVATWRYLRASALLSRVARNSESLLQFGQVRASASCWPRA